MSTSGTGRDEDLVDAEVGADWRELPRTWGIRRRLKLTVEQFAERFHIPVDAIRAWEAGTSKPDALAEAYLRVIARHPKEVAAVLSDGPKQAAE